MPHINSIEADQATGEAAELFASVQEAFGMIPPPLKLFANNPRVAKAVFEGFAASMACSSLSQQFFAWQRYLLAKHTNCRHCVDVNAGMLLEMGVGLEDLAKAQQDATKVQLPNKELALLLATLKVVRDQQLLAKDEIDNLKKLGNSDAELVAAFQHAAHTQATDLMINAFGL